MRRTLGSIVAFAGALGCANSGQILNDALATALAAPAAGVAGNAIQNGGFEAPVVPSGRYQLFASGQSFPGWQVIGVPRGNVAPISGAYGNTGVTFNAHSGAQWLDMTGLTNSASGVQQTLRTRTGARYALSFFIGNVSARGFGTSSAVEVLIDHKSVGVFRNDTVLPRAQHWRRFEVPFTATSAATTIAFLNRDGASDNSNGLDDSRTGRAREHKRDELAASPPLTSAAAYAAREEISCARRSTCWR